MKINRKTLIGSVFGAIALLIFFLITQTKTEIEDVKAAVDIMEEFMDQQELKKLATTCSYGGVFHKEHFMPKDTRNLKEGIIMWYCFDPQSKKFFMAIERADSANLPKKPGKEQLVSDQLSVYDDSGINNFLLKDRKKPIIPHLYRPDTTSLKIKGFKEFLKASDPGDRLKQVHYAFFQNNKSKCQHADDKRGLLQQLCEQPGTEFIRYYFGCDSKQPSNKIRVLLFSVDKDGNNILEVENGNKLQKSLVLQRSIPPVNP